MIIQYGEAYHPDAPFGKNMSTLHALAKDARPREKCLLSGPESLSDAELLAIVLRTGIPGCNAICLAEKLLHTFGSLQKIFTAPKEAILKLPGMGETKYVQLRVIVELAKRQLKHTLLTCPKMITRPDDLKSYLALHFSGYTHEVFLIFFLNSRLQIIAYEELFQGSLTHTHIYPRELIRRVLHHNAASVILAHNHPSGSPEPSSSDRVLTEKIQAMLQVIDVQLIDHLIIAEDCLFAFSEAGLLGGFQKPVGTCR